MSLSKTALKNSVVSISEYALKLLINFITVPIIIRSLGVDSFGIWRSILRASEYFSLSDFRSSQTLKWLIATKKDATIAEKQDWLSTCMFLLVLGVLLILIVSAFLIYLDVIKFDENLTIIFLIAICAQFIMSFANISLAIIQGTNNGYKRFLGIFFINIAVGISIIYFIKNDFGLEGLAISLLFANFSYAIYFVYLSKKIEGKLIFSKIRFNPFTDFYKKTLGFLGWSFAIKALMFGDVILIIYLLGSKVAGEYSLLIFLPQTVVGIVSLISMSAMPGLGKIVGEKKLSDVGKIRHELNFISWFLFCLVSTSLVLFNDDFIHLWVKDDSIKFGFEILLIILMNYFLIFIRNDAFILDLFFSLKVKIVSSLISLILMAILSILLSKNLGIIGICYAVIISRVLLMIFFSYLVRRRLPKKGNLRETLLILLGLVILCSSYLIKFELIQNWINLFISASISVIVTTFILLIFCGSDNRAKLTDRLKRI